MFEHRDRHAGWHSGRHSGWDAGRHSALAAVAHPAGSAVVRAVLIAVIGAVALAGCGAAHRSHDSTASGAATNGAPSVSASRTVSTTSRASHPAAATSGRAGSSGATAGGQATTRRPTAAFNAFGPWTGGLIDIDGTRVGAVTIGMTTAQAERASGLTPWYAAAGFYRPAGLRPGYNRMFFREDGTPGRLSCIGAQQSAPIFLGQRVQTTAGVGVGDPVVRLRSVYGSQLREIAKPASGSTASAGYVVTVPGGRISFATDDARTRITAIGVGPNATPSSCP